LLVETWKRQVAWRWKINIHLLSKAYQQPLTNILRDLFEKQTIEKIVTEFVSIAELAGHAENWVPIQFFFSELGDSYDGEYEFGAKWI